MTDLDLSSRDAFAFWHREKVRFSDTDMIGHVNNVAFAAIIESGRVAFTHSGVIPRLPPDTLMVMARLEIDYRAEVHWPADLDVGSCVIRVGRTSLTLGNGVFRGETCVATARTVIVAIGRQSRKPQEFSAELRTHLAATIPPSPSIPVP